MINNVFNLLECPTICPALYAPVCGNNGVTYSNACELGVAACKNLRIEKAHDGPCKGMSMDAENINLKLMFD